MFEIQFLWILLLDYVCIAEATDIVLANIVHIFLRFLSSSVNLRLRITTISDVLYEPANVFTMLLWDVLHVLQFLCKHSLLIKVVVGPESNMTFSNLLDLTADIVSTTIIVIGARLVLLGSTLLLLMVPCSLLFFSEIAQACSTKLLVASSLLGAFPVVTFIEIMLLSQDNCIFIDSLTIPKSFPYNTGLCLVILASYTIFLSSTGTERHLLNANGFAASSFLFLISVELSSASSSSWSSKCVTCSAEWDGFLFSEFFWLDADFWATPTFLFFEVFYQCQHGNFLRCTGGLHCSCSIFIHRCSALVYDGRLKLVVATKVVFGRLLPLFFASKRGIVWVWRAHF